MGQCDLWQCMLEGLHIPTEGFHLALVSWQKKKEKKKKMQWSLCIVTSPSSFWTNCEHVFSKGGWYKTNHWGNRPWMDWSLLPLWGVCVCMSEWIVAMGTCNVFLVLIRPPLYCIQLFCSGTFSKGSSEERAAPSLKFPLTFLTSWKKTVSLVSEVFLCNKILSTSREAIYSTAPSK